MMLPTGDPLGTVVTMLATPFGRLDGLAIDTAGAGGWRPTGSPPDSTSEGVIDGLPGSVSFPRRKVVVDGPPWGKIVGQRSPDTAIAVAVEDGINHGPHLGLAWPPTDAGWRQEGFQDSPLLACQITGVWLWVHTLSTFETPLLEQTLTPLSSEKWSEKLYSNRPIPLTFRTSALDYPRISFGAKLRGAVRYRRSSARWLDAVTERQLP